MTEACQGTAPLCLEGEFNIFTAAATKDMLLAAIASTADAEGVNVDLANITEIDTAGLQLMVMARREAEACGRHLNFIRCSPAVLELVDLCALRDQLGDSLQSCSAI